MHLLTHVNVHLHICGMNINFTCTATKQILEHVGLSFEVKHYAASTLPISNGKYIRDACRFMTAKPAGIKLHAELCQLLGYIMLSYLRCIAWIGARTHPLPIQMCIWMLTSSSVLAGKVNP